MRRTVLKTCGRSRTWQIVQMPSRASATATPLRRLRDQLEDARAPAGRAPPTSAARSAAMRSSDALQLGVLRRASASRSASTAFCSAASAASAVLTRGRQVVGLDHPLEHLVFERLDLGLRERDLVLDRVVFLVGLHRHRLLAELRQAALVHRDVLLDRRAARSGSRRAVPWRRRPRWRAVVEPRVERLLALGLVGEPPLARRARRVELLERDERSRSAFMIIGQKKPRRSSTGADVDSRSHWMPSVVTSTVRNRSCGSRRDTFAWACPP